MSEPHILSCEPAVVCRSITLCLWSQSKTKMSCDAVMLQNKSTPAASSWFLECGVAIKTGFKWGRDKLLVILPSLPLSSQHQSITSLRSSLPHESSDTPFTSFLRVSVINKYWVLAASWPSSHHELLVIPGPCYITVRLLLKHLARNWGLVARSLLSQDYHSCFLFLECLLPEHLCRLFHKISLRT